jgi:hypothetical protein
MGAKTLAAMTAAATLMLGASGCFADQSEHDHSAQTVQPSAGAASGGGAAPSVDKSGAKLDVVAKDAADGKDPKPSDGCKMMQAKQGGGQGGMGGMGGGGCCRMMMKMKHGQSAKAEGAPSSSAPQGDDGASSVAFSAVSDKMHRNMTITYTGNADADFAKLMIAEHQAALDLARITLSFGKDAEVRKQAEAMIKARESELETLIVWAAKNQK